MTRTWLALLAAGFATACGGAPGEIEREDFPRFAADIFCDRFAECARGDFDRTYFDRDDCVEHTRRDFVLIDESFDDLGCDYEPVGAGRAWDHLADMTCEEFYEAEYIEDYDKVWDCT